MIKLMETPFFDTHHLSFKILKLISPSLPVLRDRGPHIYFGYEDRHKLSHAIATEILRRKQ